MIDYWAKFEPEVCYHIYNRCIGREQLFIQEDNYRFFLKKYWKYLENYFSTYAYALIPNHFHFLIKCKTPTPEILNFIEGENTIISNKFLNGEVTYNDFLVRQFKRFFKSYVDAFNIQSKRKGTLLQQKFKRILLKDAEHFRFILFYIHHNGVHHELGEDFEDWAHSSYLNYLNNSPTKIAKEVVLNFFADENDELGLNNFIQFHKENKNGIGGYPNVNKIKNTSIDFDDW